MSTLLGTRGVELHNGRDVPAGIAHGAAVAERAAVSRGLGRPAAPHPFDIRAYQPHEVGHVFGVAELCDR